MVDAIDDTTCGVLPEKDDAIGIGIALAVSEADAVRVGETSPGDVMTAGRVLIPTLLETMLNDPNPELDTPKDTCGEDPMNSHIRNHQTLDCPDAKVIVYNPVQEYGVTTVSFYFSESAWRIRPYTTDGSPVALDNAWSLLMVGITSNA